MPGAQPRRGFEQRLASAARRGAAGSAPGVYRVQRARTVTVQGNDLGAAAVVPADRPASPLIVRPINSPYSFQTSAFWTITGDAPALGDQVDGTTVSWFATSSPSGFFPPYVQGTLETKAELQAAIDAGATNIRAFAHTRASCSLPSSRFPSDLRPQVDSLHFRTQHLEVGNPGENADTGGGPDGTLNNRVSRPYDTGTFALIEPLDSGSASSLAASLAVGTSSFHIEINWDAGGGDPTTTTIAEFWLEVTWDYP